MANAKALATGISDAPLLEVKGLKKYFAMPSSTLFGRRPVLKAVDDVNLSIKRGETLGLVGESGCGKTTVGRTIIRLYEPTAGSIHFEGVDIAPLSEKALLPYRKRMQMIFQDPYASLNPRMTVSDIIGESLDVHKTTGSSAEREARIQELLALVGLCCEHASRFPHEFSGGQRQRVGIARSLAVNPQFVICDEPISALDVSIQAQVINMMEELQARLDLTYLFIAHDLAMVKHISTRVAVMYLGQIVELADTRELYRNPLHPYSRALLSAIPIPDPAIEKQRHRIILEGDVPSPIDPPPGCRFRGRCQSVRPECSESSPQLVDVGGGHQVSCHLV